MRSLSTRENVVVIADEAHRRQYGFGGKVNEKTGEMSYGFACNTTFDTAQAIAVILEKHASPAT